MEYGESISHVTGKVKVMASICLGRLCRKWLEVHAQLWLYVTPNVKAIQIYLDVNILKSVRDRIGQTPCSLNIMKLLAVGDDLFESLYLLQWGRLQRSHTVTVLLRLHCALTWQLTVSRAPASPTATADPLPCYCSPLQHAPTRPTIGGGNLVSTCSSQWPYGKWSMHLCLRHPKCWRNCKRPFISCMQPS